MNRFLCIGDPHIRVSNIQDVDLFIERLFSRVLNTENFEGIVVLGDTLHDHERLHTTPMNKAIEFFVKLSQEAHVWILVGNHDATNNQIFLNENHWLVAIKNLPNVTVVDTVVFCEEYNVAFMPYVPNGRMAEALATNTAVTDVSCIFAHQEIQGCVMGAFVSEHGDVYAEDSPPLISGHIHKNQQPQPNVYYPGSMLQHAFGESTKNVVAIATIPVSIDLTAIAVDQEPDSAQVSIQQIDLELPRKITLYTDAEKFETCIRGITEESTSHTRIVVEGTADEFKALRRKKVFKALKSRGAKIVFKSRVLELTDPESQKTTDDFVAVLQEMCGGNGRLRNLCDELLQQTLQEQ